MNDSHAKPVVLVPACNRQLGHHPFHIAGKKYVDFVRLAGCLPLVVPNAAADEVETLLAQALRLVQLDEQLAAQERIGAHQRGARQVHRADGLLRELARARLALVHQVDLEGSEHRGDDERRDQQEGAGEKTHSSGTNT